MLKTNLSSFSIQSFYTDISFYSKSCLFFSDANIFLQTCQGFSKTKSFKIKTRKMNLIASRKKNYHWNKTDFLPRLSSPHFIWPQPKSPNSPPLYLHTFESTDPSRTLSLCFLRHNFILNSNLCTCWEGLLPSQHLNFLQRLLSKRPPCLPQPHESNRQLDLTILLYFIYF